MWYDTDYFRAERKMIAARQALILLKAGMAAEVIMVILGRDAVAKANELWALER